VSVIIADAEQRSPEWFALRAGRLTGSAVAAVFATVKTGEAAARRDLRYALAIERITGQPYETSAFVSPEMQRGIDLEPTARSIYEAETGNFVRSTGFIYRPDLMVGCSLDGDVRSFEGIIEIKCPKSSTMVEYITEGVVPSKYVAQIMHNLWITGAEWCDFVAYDDRLPDGLQFYRKRVFAHELDLKAHEAGVLKFLAEVDSQVGQLRNLIAQRGAK
jgi:putative phage-type endonuclease